MQAAESFPHGSVYLKFNVQLFCEGLDVLCGFDIIDLLGHVLQHHARTVVELCHAAQIRFVIQLAETGAALVKVHGQLSA